MTSKISHAERLNLSEDDVSTAIDPADLPAHFVGIIDSIAGRERTHVLARASRAAIDNIRRKRVKRVDWSLFAALRGAAIRAMENRIRQLQHEIELAHQYGARPGDVDLVAAAAQVAKLAEIVAAAPR